MIEEIKIENFCSESNKYTLKLLLGKQFVSSQIQRIKKDNICMNLTSNCLLVRQNNIILHIYEDKSFCLVTNANTISEGIYTFESIMMDKN